jgi:hypothetical protein
LAGKLFGEELSALIFNSLKKMAGPPDPRRDREVHED